MLPRNRGTAPALSAPAAGAGLLAVAAAGVVPGAARARLPVLALLCSGLAGERLLLARLHMVLERDPAEEVGGAGGRGGRGLM